MNCSQVVRTATQKLSDFRDFMFFKHDEEIQAQSSFEFYVPRVLTWWALSALLEGALSSAGYALAVRILTSAYGKAAHNAVVQNGAAHAFAVGASTGPFVGSVTALGVVKRGDSHGCLANCANLMLMTTQIVSPAIFEFWGHIGDMDEKAQTNLSLDMLLGNTIVYLIAMYSLMVLGSSIRRCLDRYEESQRLVGDVEAGNRNGNVNAGNYVAPGA